MRAWILAWRSEQNKRRTNEWVILHLMAQEYKVLTFLPTATDIHNHTDRQKVKSIGAWESPWIDPCRGFDVISPSLLLRFTAASRSVALIFCWLFSYSYGGLASFFAQNLFSSWRQTCHYSKLSNLFHSFSLVRRQTDFALRVRLNWQRLPSIHAFYHLTSDFSCCHDFCHKSICVSVLKKKFPLL